MNIFGSSELINQTFPEMTSFDLRVSTNNEVISNTGKAGNGVRLRERAPLVQLSDSEINKYFSAYYGDVFHFKPEEVPYQTAKNIFSEDGQISWDIGCGRGERIIELAKLNPNKKYAGVDIHTRSLHLGSKAASLSGLDNVHFIRADANSLMNRIPNESAEEVAILFPAPQPNKIGGFSDIIQDNIAKEINRILGVGQIFEFATDSEPYFNVKMRMIGKLGIFACELEAISRSVESRGIEIDLATILTRYQKIWEAKKIPTHRAKMTKII